MKPHDLFTGIIFAVTVAASTVSPLVANHVIHEKRDIKGNTNWIKTHPVNPTTIVPVRLALKQQNLDLAEKYLLEVSDPTSSKYGQHYTQDAVAGMFAPSVDAINAVKSWLIHSGIPAHSISSSKSKGWVNFETTIGQLEKTTHSQYHYFTHAQRQEQHIGVDEYSLPTEISEHVAFIYPAVAFAKTTKQTKDQNLCGVKYKAPFKTLEHEPLSADLAESIEKSRNCSTYVTPKCIKDLYGIPNGTLSNPKNKLGIFLVNDDTVVQSDLEKFYRLFAPEVPSTYKPIKELIDYGNHKPNASNAGGEPALDFEMAIPIIYPQKSILFMAKTNEGPVNASDPNGPYREGLFNQFLDAVDGSYASYSSHNETGDDPGEDGVTPHEQEGTFKPTNVISFSLALPESDYPANYLERQCEEFLKLGLQGVTLVFASGDGGVTGYGSDCLGSNGTIFKPNAPAACPWVTTVGATFLRDTNPPLEVASELFGSGGGFSNVWTVPSYQKNHVARYFAGNVPNFESYNTSDGKIPTTGKGVFNRGGRGFPDIAAIGSNGVIIYGSTMQSAIGTSMSAPIVAAMFTRVNEERTAKGKAPIGFANPALYRNTSIFNDVTIGSQNSTLRDGTCDGKYFKAAKGWDPVTGLGTPKYAAMLEYFMSLK